MYCVIVGLFLQSAFRSGYFAFQSDIDYIWEFSRRLIPHLRPCIIVGVLYHVLMFYFIIWLLESSLGSHKSSLTIFSSTWCSIKGVPFFYFVVRCVSTGTEGWCMQNNLRNWLRTKVISAWYSPFFSWKWKSTQNQHWVSNLNMWPPTTHIYPILNKTKTFTKKGALSCFSVDCMHF